MSSKTLRQALAEGIKVLRPTLEDEAEISARFLLADVLKLAPSQLLLTDDRPLTAQESEAYSAALRRRLTHEPVAYITGRRDFYDLSIAVDHHVLIPRPETEQLIKMVIDYCRAHLAGQSIKIIDVGTGSGAIALALATHLPATKIIACDASLEALSVANQNADRLRLTDRIEFEKTNLLQLPNGQILTADIIVANLPYIPTSRLATLDDEVQKFEPTEALDGGPDGLAVYRELFGQLTSLPEKPRILFAEIDENHSESFARLVKEFWPNTEPKILADLAGLTRYAIVEFSTD